MVLKNVSSKAEEAELREAIQSIKLADQRSKCIPEKRYWEVQAHPVKIIADAVNGIYDYYAVKIALEIILADQNLIDANYDLLLQYISKEVDKDVFRALSHSASNIAGEAQKKRIDDLLKICEDSFKTRNRYECVDGLVILLASGLRKTGSEMAKEGSLPLGPIYQRKRILDMLLQLLPEKSCHERVALALGRVAWIDAETAQTVLTELKKSMPPIGNAIAEAQAAVDYYAQKAAAQEAAAQKDSAQKGVTPQPPGASLPTPAKP